MARKLRRAVRAAKLPRSVRKRVRYTRTRRTVTFVALRARTASNDHERAIWVRRIVGRLKQGDVRILYGQL